MKPICVSAVCTVMAEKRNVEYTRKQCAKNYSDLRNKKMETQEITHMVIWIHYILLGQTIMNVAM